MDEMRVLMQYTDTPKARSISEYERTGGYQAIRKVIPKMKPEEVIEMIKQSELRGRGGAGFPTGNKWGFVPKDPHLTKYLVCNCDESEPGTFKDRLLIEKDPHQLIEGIILASYAIGASMAFIYCRGEYFLGLKTLNQAVQEAKEKGYLGSLEVVVHPGAGAYIAGEETAQLNSLEGYRATPRLKPPFPALVGLYGEPTIINNVETLCNVVHILNRGVEWFLSIGKPKNRGTKIFQVSGQIRNPGCYEYPLGVHLRTVLERAGWMLPGRKFKACYPGGSSCSLLVESDLDIEMDFETLAARKSALGTASIIVMDDTADMVKVAHRLMQFYQNESCGKCTPCREGTRWVVQILERILLGKGTMKDMKTIEDVCHNMEENSFCPLAIGAAPSILSAMVSFKEEFVQKIMQNPDYDKLPTMLISYPYLVH
jgi:NADH-quinone oxidoreductase subunit F